ncbi:MAG: DUF5606 domain-containing protein [Odoribacteraceae bacterium]|jgi:hypothetical protein|nr:DUF5606 domain-containing protein [Odoribacteraceae bacterium]
MLKDILSIPGRPGLYKKVSETPRAIIVESLQDGKRSLSYTNTRSMFLVDVSLYAEPENVPLETIFKRVFEQENGGKAISHKERDNVIIDYMEKIIPGYDQDRVYPSDMKKILQWYNILQEKNMLHFPEETPGEEENKPGE